MKFNYMRTHFDIHYSQNHKGEFYNLCGFFVLFATLADFFATFLKRFSANFCSPPCSSLMGEPVKISVDRRFRVFRIFHPLS